MTSQPRPQAPSVESPRLSSINLISCFLRSSPKTSKLLDITLEDCRIWLHNNLETNNNFRVYLDFRHIFHLLGDEDSAAPAVPWFPKRRKNADDRFSSCCAYHSWTIKQPSLPCQYFYCTNNLWKCHLSLYKFLSTIKYRSSLFCKPLLNWIFQKNSIIQVFKVSFHC